MLLYTYTHSTEVPLSLQLTLGLLATHYYMVDQGISLIFYLNLSELEYLQHGQSGSISSDVYY